VILALLPLIAAVAPSPLHDFVSVVERVAPTVVNVSTVRGINARRIADSGDPADLERLIEAIDQVADGAPSEGVSLGSGFVVRSDGLILTNFHVIEGATEVRVQLANGTRHRVEVVASDRPSDLALLRIPDAEGLPVATFAGVGSVRPGQWVLAIGAPFGLGHSVTAGIVSATGRTLEDAGFIPFIQTDVAINTGNSGGPLFNAEGEVVGVNSQIYSQTGGYQGVSLAIPIDMAMQVVDELLAHGEVRWGWLGLSISEPVWRDGSQAGGAVITRVAPGGPARAAGLEVGDRIVAIDEVLIRRASDLPAIVATRLAGTGVSLGIVRDGHLLEVNSTLGEQPAVPIRTLVALAGYGLILRDLEPQEMRQLALAATGVQVVQVLTGTAARAGFRAGDVVVQIDGRGVDDASDMTERLRGLADGVSVPVLVERAGSPVFLPLAAPGAH
jgi:serine protease Do